MALRTIVLKGRGIRDETLAAGTITPGHLIEHDGTDHVVVHSTAAANAQKMFAVENELIGNDIDVDYLTGDTTLYEHVVRGGMVNALLAAAATAVPNGAFLESAGDGTLRILTADAATDQGQRESIVAIAREAVDNSGGGTPVRIKVEVV